MSVDNTITYESVGDTKATTADAPQAARESDYDTGLITAMANDAQRVSEGALSGDAFWEKYDEAAREAFGEIYEQTPNPAVDHDEQTVSDETATELSCSSCSIDDVADGTPATEETAETPTWTMVIDLQKCVGCSSCTAACKAENRTPPGVSYNVVMEQEHGEFPNVTRTQMPRPCLQCEHAPCVQVCPTAATYKLENGITRIDYDRCIGCRSCVVACPYGARYFNFGDEYDGEFMQDDVSVPEYGHERDPDDVDGVAMKCNYCYHRLQRGEEPACVETCIGDARYMGDASDPESDVAEMINQQRAFRLKDEQGTNPNMYYLQ